MGQERSEGRAGHPAHALHRGGSVLPRPAGSGHERHPGTVEDPRHGLEVQDRAVAQDPDPLSAALLPGGRPLSPVVAFGLVPGFPRTLSFTALHLGHEPGSVHRGRVERDRAQGVERAFAVRHLRHVGILGRLARRARQRCDPHVPPGAGGRARSHRATQPDRGARRRASVRSSRLPAAVHDPPSRACKHALPGSGGSVRSTR